jgi:hypothetical protein
LIAKYNQIHCVDTLGVLLQAKQRGGIERVAPFVEILHSSPIHYGDILLSKVLDLAGEKLFIVHLNRILSMPGMKMAYMESSPFTTYLRSTAPSQSARRISGG